MAWANQDLKALAKQTECKPNANRMQTECKPIANRLQTECKPTAKFLLNC